MTATRAIAVEPALAEELRRVLGAAGYDGTTLPAALELPEDTHLSTSEAIAHVRRLGSEGKLPVLARLFLAGLGTDRGAAAAALAPLALERLEAAGILVTAEDGIRSTVRITPHGGLLIASDQLAEDRLDIVPSSNPAASTLWRLTVRAPVHTALDLGAGSGVQALSLAAHAREVLATDVSEPALELLSLGARLNGIENVTCARGSWFEPVADRRFDLIVANPPFVISPGEGYVFRDSGMPADAVCRMLVERAPEHLRDGGLAQIQCNWVHEPDGDWSAPLRCWVQGTGCDALLLRYSSEDPLTYAAMWNLGLMGRAPADYDAALDRWLDYYRDEGIRAIGLGSVVLRRQVGRAPLVHAVSAVHGPLAPGGDHVARLLEAPVHLHRWSGDALLGERLELVDGHRVDQRLSRSSRRYARRPAVFSFPRGIGVEAEVATAALPVLFECDGSRPLGELVEEAGARATEVMEAARTLIARGFLVPGGRAG